MKILEVGSGRGGGLNYIQTYLHPESTIGIDYSQSQVDFCRQIYKSPKISFHQGDSEHLDQVQGLAESSFDEVLNVESSHCYGNFEQFCDQVYKALKPEGYFVITDFRTVEGVK